MLDILQYLQYNRPSLIIIKPLIFISESIEIQHHPLKPFKLIEVDFL